MNNFVRLLRANIRMCGKPIQSQSISPLLHSRLSSTKAAEFRTKTFQDALPGIVSSLLTNPKLQDAKDVEGWIKEILQYNLKGGKLGRGLTTVMAYETLEKSENITDKTIHLSCIVGWCAEMLQAYFIMADDIMDGSVKRRGIPCWYTLPNVGMRAVNDSAIVYLTMNYTLKSHVGHLPQYMDIMDLFNEASLLTSIGQLLDCTTAQRDKNDYNLFTRKRYDSIVKYKTSYYTYKLPVCAGMLLANVNDRNLLRQAEEICLKIGELFQMQDDFIDLYGLESVTGKLGTDIQTGKCSWLAVTALELCNDAQRRLFTTSYGSPEPADVENIKKLYEELDLPNVYRQEQSTLYNEVVELVNSFDPSTRLSELFLKLLDDIYNRNK